jgi:hypothetical protein
MGEYEPHYPSGNGSVSQTVTHSIGPLGTNWTPK